AKRHDGVGTHFPGMRKQRLVRIAPRVLGKPSIDADVAAADSLQECPDASNDVARAHDYATSHADVADDLIAGKVVGRCDQDVRHVPARTYSTDRFALVFAGSTRTPPPQGGEGTTRSSGFARWKRSTPRFWLRRLRRRCGRLRGSQS